MTSMEQTKCKSVSELLSEVTKEVEKAEAKKPFKAELESFAKKLDGAVSDYELKYRALREKWCTQHKTVETLHASLKSSIPDWKATIAECICPKRQALLSDGKSIEERRRSCYGKRQHANYLAAKAAEDAKARLDALVANAQRVAAVQSENDKLIKEVTGYLSGDKVLALNAFYFKLLPQHKAIMPDDAPECLDFAKDASPDGLCVASDAVSPAEKKAPSRPPPRLLDPARYRGELDCAWGAYHEAKVAAAAAESAYKAAPDDLTALEKKLDADTKGLDDAIMDCLKGKVTDSKDCCKDKKAVS